MIHYAKLSSSPRLQRLYATLKDGKPKSTRDIMREADICAVNTAVAELRHNGYEIDCLCLGQGRYVYQLVE